MLQGSRPKGSGEFVEYEKSGAQRPGSKRKKSSMESFGKEVGNDMSFCIGGYPN